MRAEQEGVRERGGGSEKREEGEIREGVRKEREGVKGESESRTRGWERGGG